MSMISNVRADSSRGMWGTANSVVVVTALFDVDEETLESTTIALFDDANGKVIDDWGGGEGDGDGDNTMLGIECSLESIGIDVNVLDDDDGIGIGGDVGVRGDSGCGGSLVFSCIIIFMIT